MIISKLKSISMQCPWGASTVTRSDGKYSSSVVRCLFFFVRTKVSINIGTGNCARRVFLWLWSRLTFTLVMALPIALPIALPNVLPITWFLVRKVI